MRVRLQVKEFKVSVGIYEKLDIRLTGVDKQTFIDQALEVLTLDEILKEYDFETIKESYEKAKEREEQLQITRG